MTPDDTELTIRDANGQVLLQKTVGPGEYVLGRDLEAELRFEAEMVSRRQARLTIKADHLLIEDLGSSNGTFVGGQKIAEKKRLWPGQKVKMGAATLEFRRVRTARPHGESRTPAQQAVERLLPEEALHDRRYEVTGEIRQSGPTAILKARDAATQREVAMKVVADGSSPEAIARFIAEARTLAQLEHPNIAPVHELGVDENGLPFYTMPLVRGTPLSKLLELLSDGDEAPLKMPPLVALLTAFQKVCDAVAFAHHQGLIHRNLEPANIVLGDHGEVWVMGWGAMERMKDEGGRMKKGSDDHLPEDNAKTGITSSLILHPSSFMSPEQARGEWDQLDRRSDIYALGAILYAILALRPPVRGDDAKAIADKIAKGEIESLTAPRKVKRGRRAAGGKSSRRSLPALPHLPDGRIPDSLAAVVRKAMAFDKAQRYAKVAELQRDLTEARSSVKTGFPLGVLIAFVLIAGAMFAGFWLGEHRAGPGTAPDNKPAQKSMHEPASAGLAQKQAPTLAAPRAKTQAEWQAALSNWLGAHAPQLRANGGGLYDLDLRNLGVTDLSPLRGMPLASLLLDGNPQLKDLSPLAGSKTLAELSIANTGISDLAPLRGCKLKSIIARHTGIRSLEALREQPLQVAELSNTAITSLDPIGNAPLNRLTIDHCGHLDLAVLHARRLRALSAAATTLDHLEVLGEMRDLEAVILPENATDPTFLRQLTHLRKIDTKGDLGKMENLKDTAVFWREFDTKKTAAAQPPAAAPKPPAATPEKVPEPANDAPADAKVLEEAKRKHAPLLPTWQFAEARTALLEPTLKTDAARQEQDLLAKKCQWLANFKSQLIGDLNKAGFPQLVMGKTGAPLPGGIVKADEQQVILRSVRGPTPVPWSDISLDSLFAMGSSFILPTMPKEIAALRKWHLGVFAIYAGKKAEGLALLQEAAQLKPIYKSELPNFEKAPDAW